MKRKKDAAGNISKLWTLADLSERLNLCDRSTRQLVQRGQIPAIRLTGRIVRFDPIQVEIALARFTTKS